MKAKVGNEKNIPAIEPWLKKKPLDHFSRQVIAPETLREPVKTLLLGAMQPAECLYWMIDVPPQGIYHPRSAGTWLRKLWHIMTAPQMVVLRTDAYLLLAAEGLSSTTGSYGLTLTFLPWKSVQAVSTHVNGKQFNLSIFLETQNTARDWSLPFPMEMEEEVRDFARSCMEARIGRLDELAK